MEMEADKGISSHKLLAILVQSAGTSMEGGWESESSLPTGLATWRPQGCWGNTQEEMW